jgi:proton-translocating NADH-quinone oxidoreductase chain N
VNAPAFVWLIALPLLAAPLIYFAGRVKGAGWSRWLALTCLLAMWLPFAFAAREMGAAFTLGTIALRFDAWSLLLAALVLTLGTLVALFSNAYMARARGEEKYYALLVTMLGVMIGLGSAGDLFNLWVWFEAMAVSSYVLVAFYSDETASLEAGVKYLVQSAAGSVLALIGIALVFAATGTLDLAQMRGQPQGLPLQAASALLIVGFGVKAALVPLHTWLPDAHAHAPSGISALLSGIVIEVGLIAILRAVSPLLFGADGRFATLILILGAVNMVVGNLLALRQTQVKRLLAFSSVAQIGYILLGLGITAYSGQAQGAQGAFFHLLNHGLMKGLAFLAAGALIYAVGQAHGALQIADLAGAARRYPLTAFALSIAVLGLGGLPPLAGFMSKWQILVAGFDTQNVAIDALVAFAALNSVLSLAYYAPLVNVLYRRSPSRLVEEGQPLPLALRAPLVALALAVIAIGIVPSLLNGLTAPAGAAFVVAFGK